MKLIERFLSWLAGLFERDPENFSVEKEQYGLPDITYEEVQIVDVPVPNADVDRGVIYCIVSKQKSRWILFRCPCGCSDVITLSAQASHTPRWALLITKEKLPTLHPSIWKDKGCLSHFWIKGGRVFWCKDTGTHPSLRQL